MPNKDDFNKKSKNTKRGGSWAPNAYRCLLLCGLDQYSVNLILLLYPN